MPSFPLQLEAFLLPSLACREDQKPVYENKKFNASNVTMNASTTIFETEKGTKKSVLCNISPHSKLTLQIASEMVANQACSIERGNQNQSICSD